MTDRRPTDPAELLTDWLPRNDDPVRPVMTLATVSRDGWPAARTVLLSEYDTDGFYFHTDARTEKIAEMDATGRAALVLHFPDRARQLVVQGAVERVDAAEEQRCYARRTPYLKVLAWLNTPTFAAQPLERRIAEWARFVDTHDLDTLAPPDTWTGRRVRPHRLLFWSGRPDTAGRRVGYTADGDRWAVDVLAG